MNLIDFFDNTAARVPDRAAYVFEGRPWPYRQVADLATRIGHGLKGLGVVRETKCAVISRNHPLAFTAMLGILKAQGTWVPLHTANGDEENLYVVEFFDVEVLFYEREFEAFAQLVKERLAGVRAFVCLDGAGALGPGLEDWAAEQSADPIHLPWEPDAMCMLRGTGGTTGRPKGVMNSNRNFETTIANYISLLRFDAPPVYLACAPLSHAATVFAVVNIALAGTMVIHRRFDALETCAAIEKHRVSFAYVPPTAMYRMLSHPRVRDFDYASLRHFLYGAAPTSAAKLGEAIAVFGPVMTQGYGQTEVPTSVTYLGPDEHLDGDGNVDDGRLLSCGRPTPFTGVALMDEDGRLVETGNIGEIVVRGGLVMKGYYKNAEATAEVSKHGWHHTGDLAYQDEEGFIYICDRKKEVIITGGFNVYPLEVEQVVLSHPAVQDCAVVGVPDETWGEAIKAVVELKPGRTVGGDELIRLCKERIGSVKAPKSVDFIDDLPRSPVGKVTRKEVRERYWSGRDRRV
jgi:acyl-CoA synthetase (AMP-forming)/AMP-acid ligase II